MSLKFMTNKIYLENVNGLKNFEESNINYDSNRDKNKQIKASFNKNGKKYEVEDSLQKFMNTMPTSNNSIFDLLKKELQESKKNNSTSLSIPIEHMKLKKNMNVNMSRKNSKEKYRVNRGITSKLFDYDEEVLPHHYNDIIQVSNKHKPKSKYKSKKQARKIQK